MNENFYHYRICVLIVIQLFMLGGAGTVGLQAQSCEGRVCLKSGGRVLYVGKDRMDMPRKKRDVEIYRNFFSRQCQRDIIPVDSVDSVSVWNSSSPQNVHILVPLDGVGWSWLYVDHPRLQVYIYASQGYSTNALGGMKAWQGNTAAAMFLIPSKSACDFYICRPGCNPVCLGDAYKNCDKTFIHRLCQSAGLTQKQEQELLQLGERNRSTVIRKVLELLDEEQSDPIV